MPNQLSRSEGAPPNRPDSVLLIHGTGVASTEDKGADWWQAGSAFWAALEHSFCDGLARCGPTVFHWSGGNSEHDREYASVVLLEDVRRMESEHQPYHLVGHSHGGSVIWMTLRKAVESDVPLTHLRSWTSIGTPFLKFTPEPIRWWRLLPLVLGVIAMVLVPLAGNHGVLVSPWRIGTYFAHVSELWQLGQYVQLLAFPLIWLIFVGIVIWAVSYASICLLSHMFAYRQRGLDEQTFRQYGDRYLGLWSPSDEAINGLASTLFFHGEVTPKWRPYGTSFVARLLTVVVWPVRLFYNSLVVSATNEFIWERVAKRLQGADSPGIELCRVSRSPCLSFEGWPALPDDVDFELVTTANQNAAGTLAAVRSALGLGATAGPDSPNVITGIAKQVTFRELVHTSYYLCSSVQNLISFHILSHSSMHPEREAASLHSASLDWYFGNRERVAHPADPHSPLSQVGGAEHRALPLLQGMGLACVALLAWISFSGLFRSYIDVLTDEYQISVIRSAAPEIVPSVHWTQALCWLQALTTLGQLPQAQHDLQQVQFQFAGDESQALGTLAATLRAVQRPQDAMGLEQDALARALAVSDDQQRSHALATLAEELASFGVLSKDALSPARLNFLRLDELQKISDAAANAGYPDVAEEVLFPQGGLSPSDLRSVYNSHDYDLGIKAILAAFLKSGRKADALALASKEYQLMRGIGYKNPMSRDVVLEAYVANGDWIEAKEIANSDGDFATMARLWIDSGDVANALEDVGKVKVWQYLMSDAAHIAAALSRAGQKDAGRQLALKAIADDQLYDDPWWNVQELIENQKDLREAGAAAELESAESNLLSRCAKDGGVADRPVDNLIEIGDLSKADTYIRSISDPRGRAELFPRLSMAFADAQQMSNAQAELQAAIEDISRVSGEGSKSVAYARIAAAQAHFHHFRLARLTAEKCTTLTDRLTAYADILDEYAIARNSRMKALVADPRRSPATRP
jgi:hypothetical protein